LAKAMGHTRRDTALEDVAQDLTLAKALKPIAGKRRMMRDVVIEMELAEPQVNEVHFDFLAQAALVSNAVAVPDHEHSDHKLRIDRRPTDVTETA
jgi:hypothetical protein